VKASSTAEISGSTGSTLSRSSSPSSCLPIALRRSLNSPACPWLPCWNENTALIAALRT
jgi:hypothetical protein